MKKELHRARENERAASNKVPVPPPPHTGEGRFQDALDRDVVYRRLVLAAILLAAFAGMGFGKLPRHAGWLQAALWYAALAGLAASCLAPRPAWLRGAAPDTDVAALLRICALLTAACGALALPLGGAAGAWALLAALIAAAILWMIALDPRAHAGFGVLATLLLGVGVPLLLGEQLALGGGQTAALAIAGFAAAVALMMTARGPQGGYNPATALVRLAAVAWALAAALQAAQGWGALVAFALACAALGALHWRSVARASFAPTVITVILIHFGAAPAHHAELHTPLWLQLAAAAVEFALLIAAGYRYSLAALARLPAATYRAAPYCIVPRLDRKWDYPVRIDVA